MLSIMLYRITDVAAVATVFARAERFDKVSNILVQSFLDPDLTLDTGSVHGQIQA